jgi:hypothetical protein
MFHLSFEQPAQILTQRVEGGGLVFRCCSASHDRPTVGLEKIVLVVGNTEDLADHQRGKRESEALDEVSGLRAGYEVDDQPVDDGLDLGTECLDAADREGAGRHTSETGVLRVIHQNEAEAAGSLLAIGDVRDRIARI